MPRVSLHVELLAHTPDPQEIVAMGARRCYSPDPIDGLKETVRGSDQARYIEQITSMGHLSIAEHAVFTLSVEGVSRALLAQLTRHRIASFSVQSQRYVAQGDFDYIIPPSIEALGPDAVKRYGQQMAVIRGWYDAWREALGEGETANQDARFVLPNAAGTRLIVTMNARELLHFFSLRCCNRAQWEIRELAWAMLAECRRAAPALFTHAGPPCLEGACPEGKRSCGDPQSARARREALS